MAVVNSILKNVHGEPSAPDIGGGNVDYTKFIILTTARTGSSYLSSLLRSHNQIVSFHEILHGLQFFSGYLKYPPIPIKKLNELRNDHPIDLLEELIFRNYSDNIHAVGFKIFYDHANQGNLKNVWDYLRNMKNLKIIHLQRSNLLESLVSLKLSMKTGQWFTTTKPKSNLWLRLDYDECLDYFKNISTNLDYFKRFFSKNEIKDIYYDELLENTEKKLDELQNFLGVDKKPMKTPLKKQTNQPLSDTILNYSELKRKFSSTKWAAFFED